MGFGFLLGIFAFLGVVLGWVAYFQGRSRDLRLEKLEQQLHELRKQLAAAPLHDDSAAKSSRPPLDESQTIEQRLARIADPDSTTTTTTTSTATTTTAPRSNSTSAGWLEQLRRNWMVWLGGSCVALAGIFMVRYSIEQGLLGPTARIVAGLALGLVLHAAAQWLRQTRGQHDAFAALAGGGSITLFAALLSALHLYHLIEPVPTFLLLTLVSLGSMLLALRHGPILAIIGIVGAYLVPLLVGGSGGGAVIVLGYTLVITAATLLLGGYVQRAWLWHAALAGGLGWWLLTLWSSEVGAWRAPYLAVLALLFIVLPWRDWLLQRQVAPAPRLRLQSLVDWRSEEGWLPLTLTLLLLAQGLTLMLKGFDPALNSMHWLQLPLLVLWIGGRRETLALHAWLALLLQAGALVMERVHLGGLRPLPGDTAVAFQWYCLLQTLLFSGLALWHLRRAGNRALWLALAVIAPLASLVLAWLLTRDSIAPLQWSLAAATLAAFDLMLAGLLLQRRAASLNVAWLCIGGHLGYALAVALYLKDGGLTLALAAQLVSLGWIIRRFRLVELDLLFKGVVMLVILRLSLNPWLFRYTDGLAWPLWTYWGSALCCFGGNLLLSTRPVLQTWGQGACLHLTVLALWVTLRFALYDGAVFTMRFDAMEAALTQVLFAVVGLVYHWREQFSAALAQFYRLYSRILLVLALALYARVLLFTVGSNNWLVGDIGEKPLLNLLLLTHGAPVLLFLAVWRWYLPGLQRFALYGASAALFIFVSLEITHLWRGNIRFSGSMQDAELYTYSIVWLIMAVAAILGGIRRFGHGCYRGGLVLLGLVIAKLFLVDMADLTGLLRVASFMGMGLALLALGYLHQRWKGSMQ